MKAPVLVKRVGKSQININLLNGRYYLSAKIHGKKNWILIGNLKEDCIRAKYRSLLIPKHGSQKLNAETSIKLNRRLPANPQKAPRPKVTVTMPAYNASRFIKKAIESVLGQDYDDFELLVIDDGSTDETLRIIKSFKNHPRLRWFTQKHQGLGNTRNRLLALSRGDYISICDADDKILPDKIKSHATILDRNPHVAVVYGDVLIMNKNGQIIKDRYVQAKDLNEWYDLLENAIMNCGATFRKEAALEVGGYDATIAPAEDYDLWLKLAEKYECKYIHELCAVYRSYPQSTIRVDKHVLEKVIKVKKNAILRRYGQNLASKFTW